MVMYFKVHSLRCGIYSGQSAVPLESIGSEQSESERSLKLMTVHSKYFPQHWQYQKQGIDQTRRMHICVCQCVSICI